MYMEYHKLGDNLVVYNDNKKIEFFDCDRETIEQLRRQNDQEMTQDFLNKVRFEYQELIERYNNSIRTDRTCSIILVITTLLLTLVTFLGGLDKCFILIDLMTSLLTCLMISEAILNKKEHKKKIKNYEKMIAILQEELKEIPSKTYDNVLEKKEGTLYDFDRKIYLDYLKFSVLELKKELTNDVIDEEYELEKGKVKQKKLD